MTTIYDIAKKTGYSPTTVSKAFNNYSDVREKTREEILRTAREMGYLPNAHARTLTTKKSWTLGVLFVEGTGVGIRHPFFGAVIESFKQVAVAKGYALMFISKDVGGKQSGYLENCRIHGVDGVVVFLSDYEDPYFLELLESDIPTVILDYETAQSHTVCSDNTAGAMLAVEYLTSLGHSRIAHISGGLNTIPGRRREEGYVAAMKTHGLELRKDYIVEGAFYALENGYAAMQRLLELPDRPTAVFASGDLLALGAVMAARDSGLSVPEDISVMGYDDIELARYVTPALTTVRQDTASLGTRAAEILLASIDRKGTGMEAIVLPVEVVVRESCAPPGEV
ncbi:putative HTH-type transcriptional repressor ExuR [Paenibacillus auburnensis]|jgi:DNA-binding LacI/PurR family transcriptional regulator|uniref:HTH-type transcriptional repressor ExuR n=1 Tax=Paenibacillus auburnensis TaxID=2905649 RepID=A0ABM9CIV3_9BACL|nr:LacI family DNA-binding transcriptional regulator [Paenibacillus auburnensis]CAH1213853.1 putative HTH-type transcriptional repressor ExuR [Paenibacillus auburnensis]